MKKIAIISCMLVVHSSAMDLVESSKWLSLQDNVKKIMACSDVQSRKAFRLTCHKMLEIKTEDLLQHSPLILSRCDHTQYMVHAAQTKNELIMQNLLNNAMRCDHEDALDIISNFFTITPLNDDILEKMVIKLLEKGRRDSLNEVFNLKSVGNSTKTFIRDYRNQNFDNAHLFLSHIMALYRTDKAMMDRYICKEYEITNPDVIITDNLTPLQVAARENNVALIELILLNSEDTINDADCDGRTPLYLTANEEIVRLLLACKNIQPNKRAKNNHTPLYKAVATEKQSLVDLFLAQPNFIINEEDKNQLTPLHIAAQEGALKVFKFFLKHTKGCVRSMTKPIHYAAAHGCNNIIAEILKNDISQLNIQSEVGETALFLASTYNQHFVVKSLLDLGAAVNLPENNSITPLWIASQNGCNNAVLLLINGGAHVNAVSKDNVTPLWKATQNGKTQIVVWLLEKGALVDHADNKGVTSLMMASQKGYTTTVKVLLEFGANPTLATNDGITAFDVAGNDKIKELLKKRIDAYNA